MALAAGHPLAKLAVTKGMLGEDMMPIETRTAMNRRGALGLAAGAALAPLAWGAARGARAAAPMLGAAPPSYYRFRLGEFEVTTLRDGAVQVEGPPRSSAKIRRPRRSRSWQKRISCRPP
jgi:hypothetical protein